MSQSKTKKALLSSPIHNNFKSKLFTTKNDDNNEQLLSFHCKSGSTDLTESTYTQVLYTENVPSASILRSEYDALFHDPRQPSSNRFAFDPWFVSCSEGINGQLAPLPGDDEEEDALPGEREACASQTQYSLKRIQASTLFNDTTYEALINDITSLANTIGCTSTTPPWTSIYINGDSQNFHSDATHGPMAWTYSLTLDEHYSSYFTGGETIMMKPNMLDYWRNYDCQKGLEAPSIIRYLPPKFGRFVAFDGRVPHGVNKVHGTNDPRKARIMIHGWFAEPQTIWFGDFEEEATQQEKANLILEQALNPLITALGSGEIGRVLGYLAIRINISPDGSVDSIQSVCDTLVADPADYRGVIGYDEDDNEVFEDACVDLKLTIHEALSSDLYFPETDDDVSWNINIE
eukprot:12689770-Ditylum_brightwellii.AAC.1